MKNITQHQIGRMGLKLSALFVSLSAFAMAEAHSGSSLRLQLPSTGEHTVFVNNSVYSGVYDRFKLDNLRPGNYRIRIMESVISPRGRMIRQYQLFNGFVQVPVQAKVWASISPNGRLFIERTMFRSGNGCRYEDHCGNSGYRGGYDRRDDDRYDRGYGRNDRGYGRYDDRDRGQYDDYYDEDWYGYNNYQGDNNGRNGQQRMDDRRNSGMDRQQESYALVLASVKRQSFDSERLKIAKNAVASGNYRSVEIAELTRLFSFESSRLEFAKYAYGYTSDKANYVVVQDAFMFSSSVSELQDYISAWSGR